MTVCTLVEEIVKTVLVLLFPVSLPVIFWENLTDPQEQFLCAPA